MRKIGFWEAFSIGVGGMIGGGIFAVLGLSVELSKSGAPLAFAIAGIIALTTAYSYSKLSVRFPSRGGTVEFIVRAYGNGILSGGLNILLLLSYVVMIALYAYAFGSYGEQVLGIPRILLSLAVVAIFTVLNAFGAFVSGKAEDLLVIFKLSVLSSICLIGLSYVNPERFSNLPDSMSILAGGMIIFLAYEGFELIANTGEDVRDVKVLPKAYYSSVILVTAVYVGIAVVTIGTLSFKEILSARDYALAEVAKPMMGYAGFLLVSLSALASTSSAINATLYGTARISYMVAKYGQIPEVVERRIWREMYEGLLVIAVLSAVLATTTNLESISLAGSCGFLIVFTAVNLATVKLRRKLKVKVFIPILGSILTSVSVLILIARVPEGLPVIVGMVLSSFAVEGFYRFLKRREISEYVSERLKRREESIRSWEEWIGELNGLIKEFWRDAEVYVGGSIARGEIEKSHDVDVIVVLDELPSEEDVERFESVVREKFPVHPIDLHFVRKRDFIMGEHITI